MTIETLKQIAKHCPKMKGKSKDLMSCEDCPFVDSTYCEEELQTELDKDSIQEFINEKSDELEDL